MSDTGWDLQRAYDEGYKDGKRDAASPWHRVEEELPENFVRCVIWDGYETDIAYLIRDCPASDKCCWYWRKCGINRKGGKLDFYKVKAWMPLPEPPKEDA